MRTIYNDTATLQNEIAKGAVVEQPVALQLDRLSDNGRPLPLTFAR